MKKRGLGWSQRSWVDGGCLPPPERHLKQKLPVGFLLQRFGLTPVAL